VSTRTSTVAIPLSQIGGRKAAASLVTLTALPPLSLYIHWPWCVRKCPYCDFNSHEFNALIGANEVDAATEAAYVQALLRDLEDELPRIWGRRVYTVFIGGGTPSLMRPQALDTLLAGIRARLPLEADAEITLEANPGTVEASRFADFAAAGINRVSIGVQSFHPQHLHAIGRIHNGLQAINAVQAAVRLIPRVNVDLMYGLPEQTVAQAAQDMSQAIALGAGHISAYHLTLEANTTFHRYPPPLPDDDACADMQAALDAQLLAAGYQHYETSAYAKPQQRSQHNQNYWSFGDYIGIGAGAHGKLSFPDRILRTVKHKHPKAYLDAAKAGAVNVNGATVDTANAAPHLAASAQMPSPAAALHRPLSSRFLQSEVAVASAELPFEFMLNALRLQDGFDLAWYTERTGQPLALLLPKLKGLENKGLLSLESSQAPRSSQTWLRPTALGQRFLNDVVDAFL
jgi:putative oxygen-independent coproporphyrinogen III oxidase